MRRVAIALAALLVGAAVPPPAPEGDAGFLGGLFEQQWVAVRYDRMALTRGSTMQVRAFAQAELDMLRGLATLMQALGGAAAHPAAAALLRTLVDAQKHDNNPRPVLDETAWLGSLDGDRFDKEYLLRVVLSHQRMMRHAIRELAASNADPAVVAYARTTLAALNEQNERAANRYAGQPDPAGPPPPP